MGGCLNDWEDFARSAKETSQKKDLPGLKTGKSQQDKQKYILLAFS